jgi:hypothetical protein
MESLARELLEIAARAPDPRPMIDAARAVLEMAKAAAATMETISVRSLEGKP